MSNVWDLAQECHDIAKSKGWWEGIEAPLSEQIDSEKRVLICSELFEAFEEYRKGIMDTHYMPDGKPYGYYSELADVVIRTFDVLGFLGMIESVRESYDTDCSADPCAFGGDYYEPKTPIELVRSLAAGMLDQDNPYTYALGLVVADIDDHFREHKQDLYREVRLKMDYNKTRSYRHGGKVC